MRALFLWIVFTAVTLHAENTATALLDADRAFDRDTAARGLDGWMSWFAADARIESATDVIAGKPALREFYAKMFARREFRIHWWPVHAAISDDGTLGYTFGRATISWRDEKGEPQKREGRYTTVWRRQPDGSYKVVFDMGG